MISFSLKGGIRKDEDAKVFVSYCPRLGIYSQGMTADQAKESLVDAIQLYIGSLYDRGLFEDTLQALGFSGASNAPDEGEFVGVDEQYQVYEFDVPMTMAA